MLTVSSRIPLRTLFVPILLPLASCMRASAHIEPSAMVPRSVVDQLLAADRAFATAAVRTDVADALEPMFTDDVIMPLPDRRFAMTRAEAVQSLRSNADNAGGRLAWAPIRAGISADGQHGFTFGYMTLHRAAGDSVPLKYMAYWVRTPEGWRVAAYKRARRPPGEVSLAMMPPALPERLVPPTRDAAVIERHRESLDAAERSFSNLAQHMGLGLAFQMTGRPDAVNMGGPDSPEFVVGAEAIGRSIGANAPPGSSPVSWAPDVRVLVASSGDLGVTIGYIRSNDPNAPANSAVPFFTIWRRSMSQEPWRYIAE